MNENCTPFTHPVKKLCSPSRVDFTASRLSVKPLVRMQHRDPRSPQSLNSSPRLQTSCFSLGAGFTTHPVSATPSCHSCLYSVSGVRCPPSPLTTLLPWGTKHLSPAGSATAPLQSGCSRPDSLLLPDIFLKHSLSPLPLWWHP